MKKLKELIEKRKQKTQAQRRMELHNEFRVEERDESLWLTHNGVAFAKIDGDTPSHVVTAMLAKSRATAVEYDTL